MKYLPLTECDVATAALNFSTPDYHVIGGCDIYTTKAAGGDKKLYRNIEHSLESQYESLVRYSTPLSPPIEPTIGRGSDDGSASGTERGSRKKRSQTAEPAIELLRDSPFGPLSSITARRTFAYLIATLNATHPDYDFSNILRPSDFHKERSLRSIMQHVDSTLGNLRPRPSTLYLAPAVLSNTPLRSVVDRRGSEVWSPRMWNLIDDQMGLKQCERYSYMPEEDLLEGDGEEGQAIWSMHYFFFNKLRKRVCYLHLRGLSVISHSPVHAPVHLRPRRRESGSVSVDDGAEKRASYWLGSKALRADLESAGYGEDDEEDDSADEDMRDDYPDDDEFEVPHMDLDEIRSDLAGGHYGSYDVDDGDADEWISPPRPSMRGVSEEVGDAMEM